MLKRVLVVTVVAVLAVGVGEARAQGEGWHGAASVIGFPIYRPVQTLGLTSSEVTREDCGEQGSSLSAWYGTGRKRIGLFESSPQPCGNPGEARVVKRVRIDGRRVEVWVFCSNRTCRPRLKDGPKNGWLLYLRKGRTLIQMTAVGLSYRELLRVAKSFERVTLTGPTLETGAFLAPDSKTWCVIAEVARCIREPKLPDPYPHHRGDLELDGTLTVCHGTGAADLCTQNWDSSLRPLRVGQSAELGGFRCTAEAPGTIACTVLATGKGFRIDDADVVAI
jgi:hypothetical protein